MSALAPLTPARLAWVERTLASLSIDECLGHLLCPEDRKYTPDQWRRLIEEVPIGGMFMSRHSGADWLAKTAAIQGASRVPVLVASDLEHGAGCMITDAVDFPWAMACGAADSAELAHAMGVATGREGRAHGIHWTFGPVADLNLNVANPVVNVRSLGDDPARAAPLLAAWIRGIQENGVAATAKHWPGDGVDDRDQHLCTSVNSLPMDEWLRVFGPMWRAAFEAGVMSVMSGHISLPAYEGLSATPARALPATLSAALQVRLLREELGFEGVLVSDAAPMIGLASRCHPKDAVVRFVQAGGDVFLFSDARADLPRLRAALRDGELTEERVRASARRVLTMKARLGLAEDSGAPGPAPGPEERMLFERSAVEMAEASITLLRANAATPLRLAPGARVLCVTIRYAGHHPQLTSELRVVREELERRGFRAEVWENPSHKKLLEEAPAFDAVFVNFAVVPHSEIGNLRLTGELVMPFWRAFWHDCPNAVFTSFGNPYTLHELPHLPNFYVVYGVADCSQRAAVRAWLGEIEPRGRLPVKLPEVLAL